MTLGQKLKKRRQWLCLSQANVAAMVGVSENTYRSWEKDKNEPSFFKVCCVANVLVLSLDYLAGSNDNG